MSRQARIIERTNSFSGTALTKLIAPHGATSGILGRHIFGMCSFPRALIFSIFLRIGFAPRPIHARYFCWVCRAPSAHPRKMNSQVSLSKFPFLGAIFFIVSRVTCVSFPANFFRTLNSANSDLFANARRTLSVGLIPFVATAFDAGIAKITGGRYVGV